MARTKQTARSSMRGHGRSMRARPNTPDMDPNHPDVVAEEPEEPIEMKAEIKHLESRYNSDNYVYICEAGTAPPKHDKNDKFKEYIICSTRFFDHNGNYTTRQLDIKSKPLKKLLKEVIVGYPGISFHTNKITLSVPFHVLWHYAEELRRHLEGAEKGSELENHLEVMMEYLDDEFSEVDKEYENLMPEGLISFEILWTLFKPGELIFSNLFGQPRVARLKKYSIVQDPNTGLMANLQCNFIDYDGLKFGENSMTLRVPYFDGTCRVEDLPALPFDFHPKKEEVRELLIKRGKKYVSLQGAPKCMEYKGVSIGTNHMGCYERVTVNGRIMVDGDTHAICNPNDAKKLQPLQSVKVRKPTANEESLSSDSWDDCNDDYEYEYSSNNRNDTSITGQDFSTEDEDSKTRKIYNLTDDQCLLCNSMVWGYTLEQKRWVLFFVELIRPAAWNPMAFDKLVLPAAQKDLVQALVEAHTDPNKKSNFDDFIANKGKGLIAVLHGPPGVGKTLTAESVAEFAKRPLYTVSAGSLGVSAEMLETSLEEILRLCTVWNAVLLLDEADVYLEERSLHDLKRNAMVSVFLRLLEYYQGILFLTTNRVKTFDEAFQSRIHIALRYRDLESPARIQVWRNFIEKIASSGVKTDVKEGDYESLGKIELNGRQIKNAARTGLSLAERKGEVLKVDHLLTVLGIVEAFERDFREGKEENKKQ